MSIDGLMPPDLVKMAVMIGDFSPIEFLRSTARKNIAFGTASAERMRRVDVQFAPRLMADQSSATTREGHRRKSRIQQPLRARNK
jgi:hypothetical protein